MADSKHLLEVSQDCIFDTGFLKFRSRARDGLVDNLPIDARLSAGLQRACCKLRRRLKRTTCLLDMLYLHERARGKRGARHASRARCGERFVALV